MKDDPDVYGVNSEEKDDNPLGGGSTEAEPEAEAEAEAEPEPETEAAVEDPLNVFGDPLAAVSEASDGGDPLAVASGDAANAQEDANPFDASSDGGDADPLSSMLKGEEEAAKEDDDPLAVLGGGSEEAAAAAAPEEDPFGDVEEQEQERADPLGGSVEDEAAAPEATTGQSLPEILPFIGNRSMLKMVFVFPSWLFRLRKEAQAKTKEEEEEG